MTKSVGQPDLASVGVHEAKTQFSKLLDRVASGEEILITNRGKVVARCTCEDHTTDAYVRSVPSFILAS